MADLKMPEEYAEMLGLEMGCVTSGSYAAPSPKCKHGRFLTVTSTHPFKPEGTAGLSVGALSPDSAIELYEHMLKYNALLAPDATRICWREGPAIRNITTEDSDSNGPHYRNPDWRWHTAQTDEQVGSEVLERDGKEDLFVVYSRLLIS